MKKKIEELRAARKACKEDGVRDERICQTCACHNNKPSRCSLLGETRFVGRKQTCEFYL